ncbi:MAG: hypothetical protein QOH71_1500 [Blastocatellia bacterium]|nr:hypothetical protein [Blastocatellia bacterium]
MKGWFSASAQQAILKEGRRYYLIIGASGSIQARQTTSKEASILAEEWPDIYVMTVRSRAQARQELAREIWCYDALLASSMTLDNNVNHDRRERAAVEAERLLSKDFASQHVLNTYLAHPMPEGADLAGAGMICNRYDLQILGDIIRTVEVYQQSVRAARVAWDDIDVRRFGQLKERAIFQAAAVRSGVFVSLVKRIGDQKRCLGFLNEGTTPDVTRLPNSQSVLQKWLDNASQYSAEPGDLLPAFSDTSEIATEAPPLRTEGRAPMAHTGVARAIDAFG